MLLYVHRDRTDYYGLYAQDDQPVFYTAPELLMASSVCNVNVCIDPSLAVCGGVQGAIKQCSAR